MTIGDCFVLTSDFHKLDLGLIFIGETKSDYYFTPLNFKNNHFNNTADSIFEGKLQTNRVGSGLKHVITGIFAIHESKRTPSFLTQYCKDNRPFINLDIDVDKIVLGQNSKTLDQVIIGGGTNFPPKKELFDKADIQILTIYNDQIPADLQLILKTK